MPKGKNRKSFPFNRPGSYRIRVLGFLEESWAKGLGSLHITTCSIKDQGPVTELVGPIRDQAELSGLLNMLYEWHLTLLSVEMLEAENN